MYSQEEYDLVHNWLQQRVWVLEQGPMDGTIGDQRGWKLSHESANHESIKKNVAYMLWGIADMNDTYFTAGVNGFEQYYKSLKSDHETTYNKLFGEEFARSYEKQLAELKNARALKRRS